MKTEKEIKKYLDQINQIISITKIKVNSSYGLEQNYLESSKLIKYNIIKNTLESILNSKSKNYM